jgi:3-hydroxy-9,10-secoandrosta-1,3,5(10)-triene-9,17-dione monooxygenase reductase component
MLAWPPGRNHPASRCGRPSPSRPRVAAGPPDARAAGGTGHRLDPGHASSGAGLTVSSVLVAEGQPARPLGLIDPTSAFWEAMQEAGAFVVHVLAVGDRALAERFGEVRPPIQGSFDRLE